MHFKVGLAEQNCKGIFFLPYLLICTSSVSYQARKMLVLKDLNIGHIYPYEIFSRIRLKFSQPHQNYQKKNLQGMYRLISE